MPLSFSQDSSWSLMKITLVTSVSRPCAYNSYIQSISMKTIAIWLWRHPLRGSEYYHIWLYFIDIMELKRMMEKLGQAKTHLELKKMIAEVDKTNSGKRTTVTTFWQTRPDVLVLCCPKKALRDWNIVNNIMKFCAFKDCAQIILNHLRISAANIPV